MSDMVEKIEAEEEFHRARRKAILSSMFAAVRGRNLDLLSFDEVKQLLKPADEAFAGTKTIEIKNIVGSEGRYRDFDRNFLPRRMETRHRWQSISQAHRQGIGLPAIQVYEIDGMYFIRDGNHRVSVARQRGIEFIEAHVTKITPRISVGTVRNRDELKRAVIDYERQQFMQALELVDTLPTAAIRFTATGRYDDVVVHIACHRGMIEQRTGETASYADAAASWYKTIYLPVAKMIRDSGVMSVLPERTEGDFYVWLIRHWDDMSRMVSAGDTRDRRLRKRFSRSLGRS